MSDYKRLVSYIYSYPGGVRDKNVGFAKAEVRNGQFKLSISLKGVYTDAPQTFGVYLMVDKDNRVEGRFTLLKVGNVLINNGIGKYNDFWNPDNIDQTLYTFDDISGIAVADSNNQFYMMFTMWEDIEVNPAAITFAKKGWHKGDSLQTDKKNLEEKANSAGTESMDGAAEPINAEPVSTGSVIAEPVTAEPMSTGSVIVEPVSTESVKVEPASAEPVMSDSVSFKPETVKSEADAAVAEPVMKETLAPESAAPEADQVLGAEVKIDSNPVIDLGGQSPADLAEGVYSQPEGREDLRQELQSEIESELKEEPEELLLRQGERINDESEELLKALKDGEDDILEESDQYELKQAVRNYENKDYVGRFDETIDDTEAIFEHIPSKTDADAEFTTSDAEEDELSDTVADAESRRRYEAQQYEDTPEGKELVHAAGVDAAPYGNRMFMNGYGWNGQRNNRYMNSQQNRNNQNHVTGSVLQNMQNAQNMQNSKNTMNRQNSQQSQRTNMNQSGRMQQSNQNQQMQQSMQYRQNRQNQQMYRNQQGMQSRQGQQNMQEQQIIRNRDKMQERDRTEERRKAEERKRIEERNRAEDRTRAEERNRAEERTKAEERDRIREREAREKLTKEKEIRPEQQTAEGFEAAFLNAEFIDAFDDDYYYNCVEVTPEILSSFPVEDESIINNSFLIHGYYNFKHILFGRVRENDNNTRYFIGVPGMYCNRERFMASMFGFNNFKKSHRSDYTNPYFGYWYQEL